MGSNTLSGISPPLQAGLKCLTLAVNSPFNSNIPYSNEGQLTPTKLEHPLTIITWQNRGLIFLSIEVTCVLKFSAGVLFDHGLNPHSFESLYTWKIRWSRDRTPTACPYATQAYQCLISHFQTSLGACNLILYIHVAINWQLPKQCIRWPVFPDCIAGSGSGSLSFIVVLKSSAEKLLLFKWSLAQVHCFKWTGIRKLSLWAALLKFLFQTDLGRENSAREVAFDLSLHGHVLVTLYVQLVCSDWSKYDRWVHAEHLCSILKLVYC